MRNKWSVVDTLFSLGAALICVGLGLLMELAVGLIGAGVFCLVGAVLVDFSGGSRMREEGETE